MKKFFKKLTGGIVKPISDGYQARQESNARIAEAEASVKIAKANGKAKATVAVSAWESKARKSLKDSCKDETASIIGIIPVLILFYGIFHFIATGDMSIYNAAKELLDLLTDKLYWHWIIIAIFSSALGIKIGEMLGFKKK